MSAESKGATEVAAAFVVDMRLDDVPSRAVDSARTVILDVLGVSFATIDTAVGHMMVDYVSQMGGTPDARVIGTDLRTSAPMAALANGTLAHAFDYDDSGHITTHAFASALAVGDMLHSSGRDVLEAFIAAREVAAKVTDATEALREQGGGPTYRGWYRVGISAPISGAVAAAKLLGLNKEQVKMALGIAVDSSSGLRRNQGTMTKGLTAGTGASAGIQAAILAKAGFTADPEILEAHLGLYTALCLPGECDTTAVTERLGNPYDLDSLAKVKPFAACAPSHIPLQAAINLRNEHDIAPSDIEFIEADLHSFSLFRADPQEAVACGFSMPYVLAVAMVDGQVGMQQVSEKMLHDPVVRDLMTRVRQSPNKAKDMQAESVTIGLRDGRVLVGEVEKRPHLSQAEIEQKFFDCATTLLEKEKAEALKAQVEKFEDLADINELVVQ